MGIADDGEEGILNGQRVYDNEWSGIHGGSKNTANKRSTNQDQTAHS